MRQALFTSYMYCKNMKNASVNFKVNNMATMNSTNKKTGPNDGNNEFDKQENQTK